MRKAPRSLVPPPFERTTYRNGSHPRVPTTTAGDVHLKLPKLRGRHILPGPA